MKSTVGLFAAGLCMAFSSPSSAESFGTGFVINSDGYILTNNHVVVNPVKAKNKKVREEECRRLTVKNNTFRGTARIIGRDKINDLAVIKVGSIGSAAPANANKRRTVEVRSRQLGGGMRSLGEELADRSLSVSSIEEGRRPAPERYSAGALRFAARSVTPGQQINLFGYPLGEYISSQMKVTRGIVVSTMGPGNDSSLIQIDAATNDGNSGGPILDGSGNVVAVLSSGYDAFPGFNFGVNVAVAKQLMDSLGVPYATDPSNNSISTEQQYKRVRPYVVFITCY
jgi:S1-C subfamily serine protease